MAARMDTAAQCSPSQCFFSLCVYGLLLVLITSCWANYTYTLHDLLEIGFHCKQPVMAEFLQSNGIPMDIARYPGSTWFTIPAWRRHRERKQKWSCRTGTLARLRQRPHKPPLPSIFLANVRSLANKVDELKLQVATNDMVKNSCILLFTETWLHSSIPDEATELAGRTAHRHDRTKNSGKKKRRGIMRVHEQQLVY